MTAVLSTTFAPLGSAVTAVLAEVKDLGITWVELGSTHTTEPHLEESLRSLEMDYLVHNFFPPSDDRLVINIASTDADVRARSIAKAKESIAFCAAIGGRLYTIHPGFLTDPDGESTSASNRDFNYHANEGGDAHYEECFALMLDGLSTLADRAKTAGIPLAVETQGSMTQAGQLLLQRPEELDRFVTAFPSGEVELNVNLAHLHLAGRAFGFDTHECLSRFSDRAFAFEISHNDGQMDDHAALHEDGWYWPLLTGQGIPGAYKIFEGRDLPASEAVEMIHLIQRMSA